MYLVVAKLIDKPLFLYNYKYEYELNLFFKYEVFLGFVNWILCRPIYQVLGRLTYCIYLLHQPVINYYVASTKVSSYFNDYYAVSIEEPSQLCRKIILDTLLD